MRANNNRGGLFRQHLRVGLSPTHPQAPGSDLKRAALCSPLGLRPRSVPFKVFFQTAQN